MFRPRPACTPIPSCSIVVILLQVLMLTVVVGITVYSNRLSWDGQARNKMSECLNRVICCSGDSVDAFALSASGNTAIRAESSLADDRELLLT